MLGSGSLTFPLPHLAAAYRLCVHDNLALAKQLQILAVRDVAEPHADPEVGWQRVLLSFTLWVLNQRQVNPTEVHVPQGAGAWVREGHTHLLLHTEPWLLGLKVNLAEILLSRGS